MGTDPEPSRNDKLYARCSPIELSIVKVIRNHSVYTVPGTFGHEAKCRQCGWTEHSYDVISPLAVERFHQAKMIVRVLAGE